VTDDLRELIVALDTLLVGKAKDAVRAAAAQAHLLDPIGFITMSDGYYLSDGGYSRLVFSEARRALALSSVSRGEVKARWPNTDVQAIVRRIDDLLGTVLAAAEPFGAAEKLAGE
jgi:hypothetical protein